MFFQRLDTVFPSLKFLGRASGSRFVVIEIRDFGSLIPPASPPALRQGRQARVMVVPVSSPPPLFGAGVFFSFFDFYIFSLATVYVSSVQIWVCVCMISSPKCRFWNSHFTRIPFVDIRPITARRHPLQHPRDRRDPSSSHCGLLYSLSL